MKDYSLIYGESYIMGNGFCHSFEFQFDKMYQGCLSRTNYQGVGISYVSGENFQSFGVKGMYNPFWSKLVTRKFTLHPYLYLQTNLVREKETFANDLNNVTPGIGLTGAWRIGKHINIRPQLQIGYRVNEKFLENGKGFTADLRIGIGINKLILRKRENRYKN